MVLTQEERRRSDLFSILQGTDHVGVPLLTLHLRVQVYVDFVRLIRYATGPSEIMERTKLFCQ